MSRCMRSWPPLSLLGEARADQAAAERHQPGRESCVSPPRALVQTNGAPLSHWITCGAPYLVKSSSRTRRTDSPRLFGKSRLRGRSGCRHREL
jgi:hypothetical protein